MTACKSVMQSACIIRIKMLFIVDYKHFSKVLSDKLILMKKSTSCTLAKPKILQKVTVLYRCFLISKWKVLL